MMHVLPLYAMAPEASFDRTVLAEGALPYSKVAQRIKEAMEPLWDDASAPLNFVFPVLGHPPMWPQPAMSSSQVPLLIHPLQLIS